MPAGAIPITRLSQVDRVSAWYKTEVRTFLEKYSSQWKEDLDAARLQALDANMERIEAIKNRVGEECAVCFLGHSGVGKSTLVNALLAESGDRFEVLPQGGIGPLTARPTVVRHSSDPYFVANYLAPDNLDRIRSALERIRDANTKTGSRSSTPDDDALKQGRLLVRGKANARIDDIGYLAGCLRAVREPRSPFEPQRQDAPRIRALRQAVRFAADRKPFEKRGADQEFRDALKDHVSGHLSPFVDTLQVGYDSDLLKPGLTVVDLPGLGIAHDRYGKITQSWVHKRAKAVALVVDRSGITQDSADLLRDSAFFSRLAHAHDPSVDPVRLFVIAVKIDLSANDAWRANRDEPWADHFAEHQYLMKEQIAANVEQCLRNAMDDPNSAAILKNITDNMSIHVVSADEYRKLLDQDPVDMPRITSAEQSGIPELEGTLSQLVSQQDKMLRARVVEAANQFLDRISADLETIRIRFSDRGRLPRAIRRLRKRLDGFLDDDKSGPRRLLRQHQESFRTFLEKEVPALIPQVVDEACDEAKSAIENHLASLGSVPWNTLRAAVVRGGAFSGSYMRIDIPNDFAVRLDYWVAVRWSKSILDDLQDRAAENKRNCVGCIAKVLEWGQDAAPIAPDRINALMLQMETTQTTAETVLREAINGGLDVRKRLLGELLNRIGERCESFCASGAHVGRGTKVRILDFFGGLVPQAIDAARDASLKIVTSDFRAIATRLLRFDYSMYLEQAADTLVASNRARLRKDEEERTQAAEEITRIIANDPGKGWGTSRRVSTARAPTPMAGRRGAGRATG